ncbi:hypothetical protein FOA43_001108 [Brettanomyces nanus]|uniref:Cyclin-like domain-containing protein n=1 Tax=Eeniella nana TaxID=13502 RepID=A0A875S3A2_EENNA|nr:uncharacterized protein FOA43_001108 [Brettanomyces nanus]QPG73794.1 hypothetical protein FOA43_001108 [Brettanomyces nanus]
MPSTLSCSSSSNIPQFLENQAHQVAIQEYGPTIYSHLVQLELSHESSIPCLSSQDFSGMRMCCLNSLFDVVNRVSWQSSTFSLAVRLLDVYSAKTLIDRKYYRMVAFCCLWIASKYNENKPKGKLADALLKRAGYSHDEKPNFLATEAKILNILHWDLSYSTTESFLDLFLNTAEPNNVERRYGALFLCELAHFRSEICLNYPASVIATSAVLVTNVALLNLRHKHICQHRFGELDTLLLKSVVTMPSAMRYKYLENDQKAALPQQYSSKATVIRNLVDLATSFLKEQRQLDMHYHGLSLLQTTSSPTQELKMYAAFPISPIASPTRLQGSPTTSMSPKLTRVSSTSIPGCHGRSNSATSLLTRSFDTSIPTPGSTPRSSAVSNPSFIYPKPPSSLCAGSNSGVTCQYATPQIFTPVQLAPPPFLFHRVPFLANHSQIPCNSLTSSAVSNNQADSGKCLKKRRL